MKAMLYHLKLYNKTDNQQFVENFLVKVHSFLSKIGSFIDIHAQNLTMLGYFPIFTI